MFCFILDKILHLQGTIFIDRRSGFNGCNFSQTGFSCYIRYLRKNNIIDMNKYLFLGLLFICISCSKESDLTDKGGNNGSQMLESDFRNFYGIAWVGSNDDNLAYAKQMGYESIFYNSGMANNAHSDSIKFFLESPQYYCYQRRIDRGTTYSKAEKDYLSRFVALKDASKSFPENVATGWFFSSTNFSTEPDFQQQRVIDFLVDSILNKVAALERKEKGFEFAGFAWDVPQLTGDFWNKLQSAGGSQIALEYWTGHDGGAKHPDVTHKYATYSDGHAAFYKTLFKKTKEKYPDAKFIMEPWEPYTSYLKQIENRSDAKELVPDLLIQEKGGIDFATNANVMKSGLVNYSQLGCTSPNIFTEEKNREVAGTTASLGSTFGWFGRFGGTGDMPKYTSIREVPARLKLVRVVPNWDNMHKVPLDERNWNGDTYSSPKSYISKDVIYSVQPRTNKLFVVFLTASASVEIPESYASASIYQTDDLFIEDKVTTTAIKISGNRMTLLDASKIGNGFIIK